MLERPRRGACARQSGMSTTPRRTHPIAVFDQLVLETIRAAEVEDHVFAVAQQAPRAAELMLDTLKMILRSAKERGQTIDEGVLRVRPPRRERAEMRFLDWGE